jgi:fimbrial chaperone protein
MKSILWKFGAAFKKYAGVTTGLLFMAAFVSPVFAAEWQVQPTTLDLKGGAKSGVFSVINNGKEKVEFQVSVQEWNQDAKGKDVYADTKDIVFFPKVMSVEGNSQRAIRIGLKAPISTKEKTYRLFVQEIPAPKKQPDVKLEGKIQAGLTIAFRFSMPIFVKPAKSQELFVIDKVEMSKGTAKAIVRNTGNVHVKLNKVIFSGKDADGKEIFSKEVAGWYILHGLALPYEAAVPKDVCGKIAKIDVNAQGENGNINGSLNVQKSMCTQ